MAEESEERRPGGSEGLARKDKVDKVEEGMMEVGVVEMGVVRLENTVMYSAGNGGQKNCGVFSKTTPLQRSSTPPHSVGHFPAESAHAHYSN